MSKIHEFKGKQANFYWQQPDILSKLAEIAKIQSTGASDRIEGIHTSDQRLQELKDEHASPVNRDEEEILGYRTVLNTIHESHDYIGIKPNIILQIHRDPYKFSPYGFGGTFKSADNIIRETDAEGVKRVRFHPVPAFTQGDGSSVLSKNRAESRKNPRNVAKRGGGDQHTLPLFAVFLAELTCAKIRYKIY